MKQKGIIIIWLLIASIGSVLAQDKAMAKAFFEKARQAYATDDWRAIIKNLEKTKEHLGGVSNPDIMYFELKARYKIDTDINEVKRLINQFLKEASPTDSRRKELNTLLATIENNTEDYYYNGIRKELTIMHYDESNNRIHNYCKINVNGEALFTKVINLKTNEIGKGYFNNGQMQSSLACNENENVNVQILYYYSQNKQLAGEKWLVFLPNQEASYKELYAPIYTSKENGKKYLISPSIPIYTNKKQCAIVKNKEGKIKQFWDFQADGQSIKTFIVYKHYAGDNTKDELTFIAKATSASDYDIEIVSFHSNGMVKNLKETRYKNNYKKDKVISYRETELDENGEVVSCTLTLFKNDKKTNSPALGSYLYDYRNGYMYIVVPEFY